MSPAAVIVAAGSGQRAGGAGPKQFADLMGRPMLRWSLDAFRAHPETAEIVLVLPAEHADRPPDGLEGAGLTIAAGGATRTQSVTAGLNALRCAGDTPVLIHDAARPGLTVKVIDDLLAALAGADGAAPALPVADALKRVEQNGALTTVPRDRLFRVQTPQAFRLDAIKSALAAAGPDLVDDLAAIEAAGGRIALTQGDARLMKVTYPEDFAMAARLLGGPALAPRMGTGFDVHAFEPGDFVTLCGVEIPHTHKLNGHSDADAGWHAVTDAILGAAALGDIGDHFPPSDPKWAGAPSDLFLKHAAEIARAAGWAVTSVDITIICERPKVKPHREAMRAKTAEVLGLPLDAVSVKATTTEGLGFTGRQEGIAAQAAAVLAPIE